MAKILNLKAPELTRADICRIASDLIDTWREVSHPAIRSMQAIEVTRFCEMVIKPIYGVEIVYDLNLEPTRDGIQRLGTFDILQNTAIIGIERDDPRWTWTVWHEVVGHGVLHGPYFRSIFKNTLFDKYIDVTAVSVTSKAVSELERQANCLAAAVSAPKNAYKKPLSPWLEPMNHQVDHG